MSEVSVRSDENCTQKIENKTHAHIVDCDQLSATDLKNKYELTYSSWKNMKQRQKKGYVVSPEFVEFRDFLRIMGPRPGTDYSIDRLDNSNKTYGPGLCAWRSKKNQNRNKSNVIMLTGADGTTLPLTAWADKLGKSPRTLYQRKREGLTDDEVLHGRKSRADPLRGLPWPTGNELAWERAYQHVVINRKRPLSESREDFLLRTAQRKVDRYVAILDATADPNLDVEMTEESEKYSRELSRWSEILRYARERHAEAARQEFILNEFAPRSSGLGRARELELVEFVRRMNAEADSRQQKIPDGIGTPEF